MKFSRGVQMTLGSLFDGIGGWQIAAKRAGVLPIWSSEIEPFPMAVTKKRFPATLQLGDVTKIDGAAIMPADIICMGSPCQDLSVAGRQEGLKGARSGLFHRAIELIRQMRAATWRYPRFVVWENVPGAFGSNRGMDFKTVLEAISQTEIPMPRSGKWAPAGMVRSPECDLAWRVLDAQYWGVPQRRKRIFLVADFGSGRRCADKILFECESLSGNIAAGGETGESSAAGTAGSPEASSLDYRGRAVGFDGYNSALTGDRAATLGINCGVSTGRNGVLCLNDQGGERKEIAPTLSAMDSGNKPAVVLYENHGIDMRIKGPVDKSPTITAWAGTGGNNLPLLLHSYCMAGNTIDRKTKNGGNGKGVLEEVSYTLNTIDRHAVVAYGFYPQQKAEGIAFTEEKATTLVNGTNPGFQNAVCIGNGQMHQIQPSDKTGALNCMHDQQCVAVPGPKKAIVRRLTPLECERLQGLPDGWTLIDDKSCSDSARYKAIGNGMAQPCADFIIRRIAEVIRMEAAGDCGKDCMQTVQR